MGPFEKGGILKAGKVYVAPAGTEMVLSNQQWTEIGEAGAISFGDSLPDKKTIRTRPPVIGTTTLTLACIPPKTRREKRERLAGLRLLFGHWPTRPKPKRQLIHNGRKP